MSIPMVTVKLSAENVVKVTSNDGGILSGYCLCSHSTGFLESRHGHSFRQRHEVPRNTLVHKNDCQMNKILQSGVDLPNEYI